MKNKFLVSIVVFLLFIISKIFAQFDYEYQRVGNENGSNGDFFGSALSVDGLRIVAGAPELDLIGSNSGEVFIYNSTDSMHWSLEQAIYPSDAAPGDEFGYSVSLSGDFLAIGAPSDDDAASNAGSVYIYKLVSGSWQFHQKLLPNTASEDANFGYSVRIAGNRLIVGAPDDTGSSYKHGAAYIYRFNGTNWVFEQKLYPSDESQSDFYGGSVSISGLNAIVGAKYANENTTDDDGAAYIYHFNGSAWVEDIKLTNSEGGTDDNFGKSVDINSNFAVVGVPNDDDNATACGSVFIYKLNGTTWTFNQQISGTYGFSYHGYSVEINDTLLLVGNNSANEGYVKFYKYNSATGFWEEYNSVYSSADRSLGYSVAAGGAYAVAGAPENDYAATGDGLFYIYGPCPPFSITSQPENQYNVCEYDSAYFLVLAENVASYQWQYRYNESSSFTDLTSGSYVGTQHDSLLAAYTNPAYQYFSYRCELTDMCGNIYYTDTVHYEFDTIPPMFSMHDSINVYLNYQGEAEFDLGEASDSLYDNCGIKDTVFSGQTSYSCDDVNNSYQVIVTVKDERNNTAKDTIIVTVYDTIGPYQIGLTQFNHYLNSNGEKATKDMVSVIAVDNCSIVDTIYDPPVVYCTDYPSVLLTVTVHDAQGYELQDTITIDVQNPYFNLNVVTTELTLYLDSNGTASLGWEDFNYYYTNACAVVDSGISQTIFTCDDIGDDTVTVFFTDMTDNFDEDYFIVHVLDTLTPVVECPSDTTVEADSSGNYLVVGNEFDPVWLYDNCSYNVWNNLDSTNTLSGYQLPESTNTIVWYIEDANGNSAECNFSVTVNEVVSNESVVKTNGITIYPVPFENFIVINTEHFGLYKIYDTKGMLVSEKKITTNNVVWRLNNLKPGIYFVKFSGDYTTIPPIKIVKE